MSVCAGSRRVHRVLGERGLAVLGVDADPAGAEAGQRLVDLAPVARDDAVSQGQVHLAGPAGLELHVQVPMGLGVAGEQDHAAGVLVDPVHDQERLAPLGAEPLEERRLLRILLGDGRDAFRLVHGDQVRRSHRESRTSFSTPSCEIRVTSIGIRNKYECLKSKCSKRLRTIRRRLEHCISPYEIWRSALDANDEFVQLRLMSHDRTRTGHSRSSTSGRTPRP